MLLRPLFALFLGILSLAQATPSRAQIVWADLEDVVQVNVRPGWRDDAGRHFAALEITLVAGWKTYWRSPGAAGIAPAFNWQRARNLSGVQVHWPVPELGQTSGTVTIGYTRRVVLPLELTPTRKGRPIRLRGTLEIGVCADICLPARLRVDAVLPVDGVGDPVIAAALADRPSAGRGQVRCALRPIDGGMALSARVPLARRLGNTEAVAVELAGARGRVWITDTSVRRSGGELITETEFMTPGGAPILINRADLRFTAIGARGAVEFFGCAR